MNNLLLFGRRFFAAACIACTAAGVHADDYDLYASYTDSVEVSLDLANLRSIEFSYRDRTLTANYRDGSNSLFDYSRIGKLYFDAATNGIEQVAIEKEGAFFTLSGNALTLHPESGNAALYGVNGALVTPLVGKTISLDGLPAGVYVLRVDNQTAKICIP